jgi:tetratricopeptide (TPR) repeat protein
MNSLLALALAGSAMIPCLWDSDTLDTELRGLPDSFDLIVGRWHRHSDAYYEDRVAKLAGKSAMELADFDDLAVAYEHLDRRDQAIEVMGRKAAALAETPNEEHQYRYHANLGTFHAHAGEFDDALAHLRTAIQINPDAHFGRERFQIELIEYVAEAQQDPEVWRRRSFLRNAGYKLPMFIASAGLELDEYRGEEHRKRDWDGDRELDWEQAHQAIGGMLRFGGLEGAELYRSLGELYLSQQHLNLAWWAFGRAVERGHSAADVLKAGQQAIVEHWDGARRATSTGPINPTQADYTEQRANADRWLVAFQEAEAAMVHSGKDVTSDGALQALLDSADRAVPPVSRESAPPGTGQLPPFRLLGSLAIVALLLMWMWSKRPKIA